MATKVSENNGESFFKDIFKLRASCNNLSINDNLQIKSNKYWKIKPVQKIIIQEREIIKNIKFNFKKYLPDICNTDLKIGLCLSGGIDSNYLLGFLTKYASKNISTNTQ